MTIKALAFENIPYDNVECEFYVKDRVQEYESLLLNLNLTHYAKVQVRRHICLCTIL